MEINNNFRPVCYEDREKYYELFKGIDRIDNGYYNEFSEMTKEKFLSEGIQLLLDWSQGKNLYKNYVQTTFYFLYDDKNNVVAAFKLRHYLNDYWRKGAGHISYCVKKDCRRKGYAKYGLHLAIKALDKILPEEDKLIKVSCDRNNFGSFLAINGNLPLETEEKDIDYNGKIIEVCYNFIDRKNRIVIKTINEKDINSLNDEYLKNNVKNDRIRVFGGYLNNTTLLGYISLEQSNDIYEIKHLNIIENKSNLIFGLFNYSYAIARVNKIKNILIDEITFGTLEKEFSFNQKYEYKVLENKKIEVNVKVLFKYE